MKWCDKTLEIRYADTDQMGIVHNGVYPIYCEIGRTHLCSQVGIPYHLMERAGFFLMVAELVCRYRAPIRYGDQVYVRTGISRLKRGYLAFDYEIRDLEHQTLLFTGSTKHIVTKGMQGRTVMPEDWYQLFLRSQQEQSESTEPKENGSQVHHLEPTGTKTIKNRES